MNTMDLVKQAAERLRPYTDDLVLMRPSKHKET